MFHTTAPPFHMTARLFQMTTTLFYMIAPSFHQKKVLFHKITMLLYMTAALFHTVAVADHHMDVRCPAFGPCFQLRSRSVHARAVPLGHAAQPDNKVLGQKEQVRVPWHSAAFWWNGGRVGRRDHDPPE